MSFKFKAVYDNLVGPEPVIEEFEASNIKEADARAWKRSGGFGYSEGNYELYIEFGGKWIDTMFVIEAAAGYGEEESL